MGSMRRFDQAGAVFSEDMTNLQDLRDRGTITGNPVIVRSPRGRATSFDGSSDITLVGDNRLNFTGSFTVSAWVKPDNAIPPGTDHDVIISKGNTQWELRQSHTSGYFQMITYDGSYHTAQFATAPTAGQWYHVCGVLNGTTLQVYVNGAAGTAASSSGVSASASAVQIAGNVDVASREFNGDIRAISIWDRALSATEVSQLAAQTVWDYDLSLVSKWDMSEINPQDVGYKGNGNNGVGVGIVASTDLITSPTGGYATQYNGTDERTNFGDVGNIRTISLLVNPDTTTEELVYIDTGKDIMVSGGTVTYTGVTASATFVDGVATTTMVAGKWQHLVCVLNADVDANLLGLAYDGTNFGAISVDHFAVFGNALEQVQVKDYGSRILRGQA